METNKKMSTVSRMLFRHQLPENREQRWILFTSIGTIAYKSRRLKMAHLLFFRAYKVATTNIGTTLIVAASRYNLALIYRQQGRYRKAISELKQSLALIRAKYGADCPRVVMLLDALGDTCVESGLHAKARIFYNRAHTIHVRNADRSDFKVSSRFEKILESMSTCRSISPT